MRTLRTTWLALLIALTLLVSPLALAETFENEDIVSSEAVEPQVAEAEEFSLDDVLTDEIEVTLEGDAAVEAAPIAESESFDEEALDEELVAKATSKLYYITPDGTEDYWGYWYHLESKDADKSGFTLNDTTHNRYGLKPGEDVTFNRRVDVVGNVELVLGDNATLKVNGGFHVGPDSSLTIYRQKGGTGQLIATGSQYCAAIGGNQWENNGSIRIFGGTITVSGGAKGAAGIGGGASAGGGGIYIFGGTVNATGGPDGAGIGGGIAGGGGTIEIHDGTVNATGNADGGAGIGGGLGGDGGEITIYNGAVNATGGATGGAGIGGGCMGDGKKTVIKDGTVNAVGGAAGGAGIGGGYHASAGEWIGFGNCTITSTGGSSDSAAIGGGKGKNTYKVNFDDGMRVGAINGNRIDWKTLAERVAACREQGPVRVEVCVEHVFSDGYSFCHLCGKLAPSVSRRRTAPDYTLLAKLTTSGSRALKAKWTQAKGAEGYDVFIKRSGAKGEYKLTKSVEGGDTLSCTVKGLKRQTCYKAYVKAWMKDNGKKEYIGDASPVVFAITGGHTKTEENATKVTVKKGEVTLKVGKTSAIKATVKGKKVGLKVLKHVSALRYYSSDRFVATVTSEGKIEAKGKGSCVIYALANNGARAKVKVTVK